MLERNGIASRADMVARYLEIKGVGVKTRMPLFYVYLPHTIFQKKRVAYVLDFLPT